MVNGLQWFSHILTSHPHSNSLVLVCDENVLVHHGRKLRQYWHSIQQKHHCIIVPSGEKHKTRATQHYVENHLLNWQCGRDTTLVALGGGVLLDMVGFVAANYRRGIPVIYVPSTLLAMVDASIGGKTAINTPQGKNTIGHFYPATDVIVAPELLDTLPQAHWYEGLAEMLKHGLIFDRHHFHACQQLLQQPQLPPSTEMTALIEQSRAIKQHVVTLDPHEKNLRHILNFGHSIGHAIESASQHTISHGLAVTMGMIAECKLSMMLCHLDHHSFHTITQCLKCMPIPWHALSSMQTKTLMSYWMQDKKNRQQQAYSVLIASIGECHQKDGQYAHPIPLSAANACLHWLCLQPSETPCTLPQ